jgi:hypothetical protein
MTAAEKRQAPIEEAYRQIREDQEQGGQNAAIQA